MGNEGYNNGIYVILSEVEESSNSTYILHVIYPANQYSELQ